MNCRDDSDVEITVLQSCGSRHAMAFCPMATIQAENPGVQRCRPSHRPEPLQFSNMTYAKKKPEQQQWWWAAHLQTSGDIVGPGVYKEGAVDAHKHKHVVEAYAEDHKGREELDDCERAARRDCVQRVADRERYQDLHAYTTRVELDQGHKTYRVSRCPIGIWASCIPGTLIQGRCGEVGTLR